MTDPAAAQSRQNARAYAKIRYRLLFIDLAIGFLFLAAYQFSGVSGAVAGWVEARLGPEPLRLAAYLAVFGAAYYLVLLPLKFYGSFVLEHRFGLSRMTLAGWVVRELKQLALGSVLSLALTEGLYALLRAFPRSWPVWATIGWVGFTVVLARVFPTVIMPLFYKMTPVQDQALVQRLLDLCRKTGQEALGVFRFDLGAETRKANAALAGLGKTRRVLLADTLIAEFPPEEIEGVLAHELAHHKYHHITKGLALSTVGALAAFLLTNVVGAWWVQALSLRGLADLAGFPALMLWFSLLGFASLPAQNGLSRHFEWEADHFAIRMTAPASVFASALRRLAALNLADPDPPRWVAWMFYDHPPITDRIRAAERAA